MNGVVEAREKGGACAVRSCTHYAAYVRQLATALRDWRVASDDCDGVRVRIDLAEARASSDLTKNAS